MPNANNLGAGTYRYGMNGMEQDKEVKGGGNSYTSYWRQYDPRLGRWMSDEPKPVAWESGYAAFRNNPIYYADPSGDFPKLGIGKFFKKIFGGGKAKTGKGAISDKALANTNAAGSVKGGTFDSFVVDGGKGPASGFSKAISSIKDWFSSTDFVLELGGKVDIGVQAGIDANLDGVVQVGVDVNLMSFDLLSGKVDLTELGSDNPDAYSGNYIGDGDGAKVTQSLGVTVGAFGYDLLGGEVEHSFKTHGTGNFDDKVDYGVYVIVPLLKNKNTKQIKNEIRGKTNVHSPKLKSAKAGKQADFYGIDFGAGAAVIIGVGVNIKIGFKR